MKLPSKNKLLASVVALCVAVSVQAQYALTFTGTANATALGYTQGQTVSFSLSGVGFNNANSYSESSAHYVQWLEESLSNDALFNSLSGTGLSGDWTRPAANEWDPYSFLQFDTGSSLYTYLSSDEATASGVVTPSGAQVYGFAANNVVLPLTFDFSSGTTVPEISSYLANYYGTYAVSTGTMYLFYATTEYISFSVSSVTIAASPIPEPSTYAAIFGLTALVGTFVYRRRKALLPA